MYHQNGAYAKEFSWNIVNTSYEDIRLLARGLEKIRLQVLRITNSDIDCDKVITILKALLKHADLRVLDFSHCKIGDRGLMAISKFLMENAVKELFLPNNRIGPKGIRGLAYALSHDTCNIKVLDIRLNQLSDDSANFLINSIADKGKTITSLSMSGCGLSENFKIAHALMKSKSLEILNISNNALGMETGLAILEAMKSNKLLKKLDLRLCKVPSTTEAEIQTEVHKNRKAMDKPAVEAPDAVDLHWDADLIAEMENILFVEPESNQSVSSSPEPLEMS